MRPENGAMIFSVRNHRATSRESLTHLARASSIWITQRTRANSCGFN